MRSIPAVTTRRPQWRIAAIPATSSQSFMITPPWTFPAVLASAMPIQRVSTEVESDGRRGGTGPGSLGIHRVPTKLKERADARTWRSLFHSRQSQDLAAPRPRGGPGRDARLRLPEAGRAAPERQEGDRRRRHFEEAAADAVGEAAAVDRQARHAGAPGAGPGARGPRADGARAKERRAERAAGTRPAGGGARAAAGEADRQREAATREGRGLPDQEGGHQGAVLGLGGTGAHLGGGKWRRGEDGGPRARDAARRRQDGADARAGLGG